MIHEYAGRRVMVLGAGGFIGAWVRRALVAQGAQVISVVRTARPQQTTDIVCDLRDPAALARITCTAAPQVVFNLAGYGVYPDERDERIAVQMNVEMVGALADAMRDVKADGWTGARIVHAGSAAEYGRASGHLAETDEPFPTTLYGRTKLAGTRLLAERCNVHTLRAVTARLFTVYGPGERAGRLVPTLVAAAADEVSVVPLTAGTQPRDFVYVEDAADAMLRLGVSAVGAGDIVNVATGILRPVREFVECAADVLGITRRRLQFGVIPERPGEMRHEPVRITRLQSLTGWQPTITPAEGIRRTQAYRAAADQMRIG